jgi:uncharacterized SAM-binding protein YcdF (DUF218 family)
MSDLLSPDFLIPPALLVLIAALAAWFSLWNRRIGIATSVVITSLLYLAALPVVAARMAEEVEIPPPDTPDFSGANAIVVLGAGVHRGDGDKVPDTLSATSLQRVYFAAQAWRQLKLKVVVSGGRVFGAHASEASLMRAALEDDFGVPVAWIEDRSGSTYENALLTSRILVAHDISTIVLVTNAWHMRRAVWSFERMGVHAIPWPAPRTYDESDRIDDYLPRTGALEESYHALHEAIGMAYYRLRY